MKVRINESMLKAIVAESVKRILKEDFVLDLQLKKNKSDGNVELKNEKITGSTVEDIKSALKRRYPNWNDAVIDRVINDRVRAIRGKSSSLVNNGCRASVPMTIRGLNSAEDFTSIIKQLIPNIYDEMQNMVGENGSPIQWKKLSLNGLRFRNSMQDGEQEQYENKYYISNYGYLIWISTNINGQSILNVSKPYVHNGTNYSVNIYPDNNDIRHRNLSAINLVAANFGREGAADINRVASEKINSQNNANNI